MGEVLMELEQYDLEYYSPLSDSWQRLSTHCSFKDAEAEKLRYGSKDALEGVSYKYHIVRTITKAEIVDEKD